VISVVERVATVEKVRDGVTGATFAFDLEVVELGLDADGDPVTTCLVRHVEETVRPKSAKRDRTLSPDEQLALDALKEETEANGQALPETSAIPAGRRGVRVDGWRQRFYGRIGERDGNARRQAFFRGKRGLLDRRLAGCWEEWAWLA
jgi:hypothetical protein